MDNGNLSQISNASNEDTKSLQTVAQNLQTAIASGNNEAMQAVSYEMQRRPGLFGIMFPGRILKANEELTLQTMKDMQQSRHDMLSAWVNIQLELTKNEGQMVIKSKLQGYEGELSQQAMQIQSNLTKFSQEKIGEMQQTFEKSITSFVERSDQQTKDAEKYRDNVFLYSKLQENIKNEIEMFFKTVDKLRNGFMEALENKLNQN